METKELLFKDLSARLPYETKVYWANCNYGDKVKNLVSIDEFGMVNDEFSVEECKPYLRPMSSMTEEEKVEYCDLQDKFLLSSFYPVTDGHALFDWLNKNMFDYRGLILKGLANSTEKFTPYKD